MMGYSGGGQFLQRFMCLHSERLLAVSIGALGSVTMLDEGLKWPHGTKDLEDVFGAETQIDIDAIRKLPIQIVVGSDDNEGHGGEGSWKWLERREKSLLHSEELC